MVGKKTSLNPKTWVQGNFKHFILFINKVGCSGPSLLWTLTLYTKQLTKKLIGIIINNENNC